MWDRTGENQLYDRQQKATEEQLRFDIGPAPSSFTPPTHSLAVYHSSQTVPALAADSLLAVPGGLRAIWHLTLVSLLDTATCKVKS